nr:UvrD-helicase domain-containing protein [Gluconobacter sp. Dm-62]
MRACAACQIDPGIGVGHDGISLYIGRVPQDLSFPPPASTPEYLSRLNPEQRRAIEITEGPLLILAGAGTGKTRVLTTRFAHILLTGRAYPSQILAVTFTNKAAREMRERVSAILGEPAEGLWLGTFHAICARMLRRHAEYVGLTSSFNILDTDDQIRLLKQVMDPWKIDTKRWPPNQLMGIIQRWKDRGLTPDRVTPAEDSDFANGHALAIYRAYQARLIALNTCDFGDLMLHVTEILRNQPNVLAQYHRSFRYILVDEYQDTNTVQYLWLRLLAKREHGPSNIACVGDDDQSIYSWRGAEVENILRFEKDFPGAEVVRLERNYRSTAQILAAAAGLIAHNEGRLGKTLRPGREDADGEKVQIIGVRDSDEEARIVSGAIERLRGDGHPLSEIAILMRAGFQTRPFEERLMLIGIPYRVVGGLRFYERSEIRDCLAYLRVLSQPADDLAFERIINVPKRGVGSVAVQKLHAQARALPGPLTAAVSWQLQEGLLKGKSKEALDVLMGAFHHAKTTLETEGHVVAAEQLLEDSGYLQMWRDDRSVEAPGRLDNIRELLRAIGEFGTLQGFLEHVALVMDTESETSDDKVSLMTLHGAKGLEFDTVFLPGWEEGVFPSQRSLDEGGNRALEEERRLAYVGLTRARRRAIVLHAASRRIYANWQSSMPSRFIEEIPSEHVQLNGQAFETRRQAAAAPSMFASGPLTSTRPSGFRAPRPKIHDVKPEPTVAIGATVFHHKFGEGTVIGADGPQLHINFENAGVKRVMSNFVEIRS